MEAIIKVTELKETSFTAKGNIGSTIITFKGKDQKECEGDTNRNFKPTLGKTYYITIEEEIITSKQKTL